MVLVKKNGVEKGGEGNGVRGYRGEKMGVT